MKHAWPKTAALAAAVLIAATGAALAQQERIWRPPVGGQPAGDIQLFRQANFNGPHVRAETAVRDLGITWEVRSIRINSGRWRVCSGVNFTGACRTMNSSTAIIPPLLSRIRSVDPIIDPPTGGGGGSLRGMSAEFFPRPADRNGQRILACHGTASAACARRTAEQFCRERGFTQAGNVMMETVNRREYLADVLCRHHSL